MREYEGSFIALQHFMGRGVALSSAQKESLREAFVKVMANKAQAHLSLAVELEAQAAAAVATGSTSPVVELGTSSSEIIAESDGSVSLPPSTPPAPTTAAAILSQEAKINYLRCVRAVDETLELDMPNVFNQRDRCLYRRGAARLALGDVDAAIEDLKSLTDAASRAKLAEARAEAKRLRDKERSMWSGAFSKQAASPADDKAASPSSLSSPVAIGGTALNFADDGAGSAGATSHDGAAEGEAQGGTDAAAVRGDHTPHPKRQRRVQASDSAKAVDDAGQTATATVE